MVNYACPSFWSVVCVIRCADPPGTYAEFLARVITELCAVWAMIVVILMPCSNLTPTQLIIIAFVVGPILLWLATPIIYILFFPGVNIRRWPGKHPPGCKYLVEFT